MRFLKKPFALLASAAVLLLPTQVSATPEQPMDGNYSLQTYAEEADLKFEPPSFDYSPVAKNAPLVKSEVWQDVGQNAMVVGDYHNALAAFDKAVQLMPEAEPELLEQRGWLHYSVGDEADALSDLSRAAALHLEDGNYSAHSNVLYMREFVDLRLDS